MKVINTFLSACVLMMVGCTSPQPKDINLAELVNPLIGTDFTGNTYPGAQAPFGMVQLSPDNGLPGWDRISGYFYPDSTIAGFSHTHLSGTGAGDLYDVLFMPVTLPYKEAEEPLGIHSMFDHQDEHAHAGYYSVLLKDYNILAELTATPRCGIQRYTFPEGNSAVILNLKKAMNWDFTDDTHIEVVDNRTVKGYRISEGWARDQRVYFCTRFSRPFDGIDIDSTAITKDDKVIGNAVVATFSFNTQANDQLVVVTALSGVSMDGAVSNMMAEATHDDFDAYRARAEKTWNEALGCIEVTGDNQDDKVNLYTALYHSMLAPTLYSDVDGKYFGPDKQIHQTEGWDNYNTFSLWDTFRAAHPLFTYTATDKVGDMVNSFIAFFEQNGRLPIWNLWGLETDMMIGYHAVPVIVDAYLKGIGNFDAEKALQACVASANIDEYRGIGIYKKKGFIPYNQVDKYNAENWSLSRTLEYAFDDYCIAVMAQKMGKTELAQEFFARSANYKNVYNPASGFMQPIDDKGVFLPNFSPDDYSEHICESNAWHYFWSVQHDVKGLIELIGGQDKFAAKLDSMFTYVPANTEDLPLFSTGMIGQYAHGNEPSHHVIYLYNKVRQPWKAQKYAAQVMQQLYLNAPAGLCGNEDCGQMSAWYIFSAMGFYPVNPVSGEYEIGSPLFPEMKLHLQNGKTFTVLAHNANHDNIYIQSVKVNGQPYDCSYITHEQIMAGATVEFEMGPQPGEIWY